MTNTKITGVLFNGKRMVEENNCSLDLSEYEGKRRMRVVAVVEVSEE